MRSAHDLLTQYARFHRDQRNLATHTVGVPLVVFALGLLLSQPSFTVAGVGLTPAWLVFAIAAAWYLSRHAVLGLATSLGVAVLLLGAHQVAAAGFVPATVAGVAMFLVGWGCQVLGHWYEGRKPAFVDDPFGLWVGPMFVAAEALFAAGWNPALRDQIEAQAGPTHLRDLAHPA